MVELSSTIVIVNDEDDRKVFLLMLLISLSLLTFLNLQFQDVKYQ